MGSTVSQCSCLQPEFDSGETTNPRIIYVQGKDQPDVYPEDNCAKADMKDDNVLNQPKEVKLANGYSTDDDFFDGKKGIREGKE